MSIDSEAMVWFLMRAAYGQEQKAQEFLKTKGIETFLPLQEHCFVRDGKRVKKMQSLIPNFLFVKSTENEMKKYLGKHPVDFLHHYYVPHKDNSGNAIGTKGIKPLVIPDEQMDAFQQWYAIHDDNKLFIADESASESDWWKVRWYVWSCLPYQRTIASRHRHQRCRHHLHCLYS